MAKIKQTNEAGEEVEVEVFTPEEVDAKLKEQEEAFNAKMSEKDTTLSNLAKEKEELEKKMGDVKQDHPNFKILKDALEKKSNEIDTLKKEVETDRTSRIQEAMNLKIKSASKGNEEFEKKVRLHLSSTLKSLPETTEEERATKLAAAVKLSSDFESSGGPGIFDAGIDGGSGNGADFKESNGSTVEFTARERALGAKLLITPEDYKKYGPRLTNKKI